MRINSYHYTKNFEDGTSLEYNENGYNKECDVYLTRYYANRILKTLGLTDHVVMRVSKGFRIVPYETYRSSRLAKEKARKKQ